MEDCAAAEQAFVYRSPFGMTAQTKWNIILCARSPYKSRAYRASRGYRNWDATKAPLVWPLVGGRGVRCIVRAHSTAFIKRALVFLFALWKHNGLDSSISSIRGQSRAPSQMSTWSAWLTLPLTSDTAAKTACYKHALELNSSAPHSILAFLLFTGESFTTASTASKRA